MDSEEVEEEVEAKVLEGGEYGVGSGRGGRLDLQRHAFAPTAEQSLRTDGVYPAFKQYALIAERL